MKQQDLYKLHQEILEGTPILRGMEFSTLDTWKDTTNFYSTKFAYEWHIIDCLPPKRIVSSSQNIATKHKLKLWINFEIVVLQRECPVSSSKLKKISTGIKI